jgi:hypothetical protein
MSANPRIVALSAVGGAVVTLLAVVVAYAVGRGVNALFPSRDANIGLGLALLAGTAALIALGVWLVLRRLGVRAAGPIAAGTVVVYLVALFVPVGDPGSAARLALLAVLVAAYTGVAAALAGRR